MVSAAAWARPRRAPGAAPSGDTASARAPGSEAAADPGGAGTDPRCHQTCQMTHPTATIPQYFIFVLYKTQYYNN